MPEYPRFHLLGDSPVQDPDTICEKKYLGSIPPKYSFSSKTYKFKSRVFHLVGTAHSKDVVEKAKRHYAAMGLHVRVKKYEAKSYGRYFDIYVGKGVWHEYTSHYRSG